MGIIFYLGTCSTCNRIIKELDLDNKLELREIKSNPITDKELEKMHALAGSYEALFSRRAMKYRELGLDKMELTEVDYKKYILAEYTFLKRPVTLLDGQIFIGNSKKTVEALRKALA